MPNIFARNANNASPPPYFSVYLHHPPPKKYNDWCKCIQYSACVFNTYKALHCNTEGSSAIVFKSKNSHRIFLIFEFASCYEREEHAKEGGFSTEPNEYSGLIKGRTAKEVEGLAIAP